jgi:hypothetical protein
MAVVAVEIVLDGYVQEQSNMGVGYAVVDLPSLSTRLDEAGETKLAQLVTRSRLAHFHFAGQIIHTEVTMLQQRIDDPQATGIGEELEALREELGVLDPQSAASRVAGRSLWVRSRHVPTLLLTTCEHKLIYSGIDFGPRYPPNGRHSTALGAIESRPIDRNRYTGPSLPDG